MSRRTNRFIVALAGGWFVLAACAPGAAPRPADDAGSSPGAAKTLAIAVQNEPNMLSLDLADTGVSQGGGILLLHLSHDALVVQNNAAVFEPQLAAEQISVDRGTWRVGADGTMETIWKIRPNVTWHDGTAFTADDMLFSFTVYKDPDIPNRVGAPLQLMRSASAPDPLTFVVHWSQTFVEADRAPGLTPLPRHLLQGIYEADKASLVSSPRLTYEFIGLGPYRLVKWEPGIHLEFARFDGYYRGRPPLDRITVRIVSDPNTIVANILAGAVDVIPQIGLDLEAALEAKRRWEGTENVVRPDVGGGVRELQIQARPQFARPQNGFLNTAVRQAFFHAIDRNTIADVLTYGLAPAADSWIPPTDALRPAVEDAIPQLPFDPGRAQSLLAQARWVRGTDGVLTHQASGERFEVEISANQGRRDEKEQSIVAENWKAIGAQVSLFVAPAALSRDPEVRSTFTGGYVSGIIGERLTQGRLHSSNITSPATRWNGSNRTGYSNPKVDEAIDKLLVTLRPVDRTTHLRQLLAETMGDVGMMPMYWEVDPFLVVKGVIGIRGGGPSTRTTWNIFEWDKE